MCLKLTIKTSERRHWRRSGVFIVNFEHILHLTNDGEFISYFTPCSSVSIVNFEHVITV